MRNLGSHRGLILCVRVLTYDCVSTLVCARQSAAENTFLGHFATHPALAQTSGFSSLLYRHLRPSTPDCSLCLVPTSISYLSGRRCPMCNLSTKDSESDRRIYTVLVNACALCGGDAKDCAERGAVVSTEFVICRAKIGKRTSELSEPAQGISFFD